MSSVVGHRSMRVVLAAAVLAGAFAAGQLAIPDSAFACSCVAPQPGAPAFDGSEAAVFIGTAGQPQPDGTFRFTVERWFKGGDAREVDVASEKLVLADGTTMIDTCGLHFEVGDRLVLTASISDGTYTPGNCSPHAAVASEEGQRLLNAAVATFGPGRIPGQPEDPQPGEMPDDPSLTGLAIGMVGILVLVILISAVAAAYRRREGESGG